MNQKYRVDIVITEDETYIQEFIKIDFVDRTEAIYKREEILSNLKENQYSRWAKITTVIKCNCGEEIECINFTNTCDECESDYNSSGQLLASRSQWGEETGEHWSECY